VSCILWTRALRPPDSPPECRVYETTRFRVPRVSVLPACDEEIVQLPEPGAYRVLNREGLMLAAVALPGRELLSPFLKEDAFRVGLYCAVQRGAGDYAAARQMVRTTSEEFAATYEVLRVPGRIVREGPYAGVRQLAALLGIQGPQHVFTHQRWSCVHALDQADHDLEAGRVAAALVCGAFSLADPLLTMQIRRSLPPACILSEGAAALVLVPDGRHTDWRARCVPVEGLFYGTAHDSVALASAAEEPGCDGATPGEMERVRWRHRWRKLAAHPLRR